MFVWTKLQSKGGKWARCREWKRSKICNASVCGTINCDWACVLRSDNDIPRLFGIHIHHQPFCTTSRWRHVISLSHNNSSQQCSAYFVRYANTRKPFSLSLSLTKQYIQHLTLTTYASKFHQKIRWNLKFQRRYSQLKTIEYYAHGTYMCLSTFNIGCCLWFERYTSSNIVWSIILHPCW